MIPPRDIWKVFTMRLPELVDSIERYRATKGNSILLVKKNGTLMEFSVTPNLYSWTLMPKKG